MMSAESNYEKSVPYHDNDKDFKVCFLVTRVKFSTSYIQQEPHRAKTGLETVVVNSFVLLSMPYKKECLPWLVPAKPSFGMKLTKILKSIFWLMWSEWYSS